ncbi:hypothetical protein N7493_005911 [Penicillium malachiteum]|uniref:Uncharacterized protein n=1 Tax=Penicillium malachiteum TaxID=1324776 RepID=A0AAD6MVW9_9EURO|nr:hypothetical protein N7493_005911 [Penicillium malachiteum]
MINEMLKRDTQIHTPEASIDQSNPALGDNTGCESATHVLTGQLDAPIPDAPIPQEVDLSELVPAWFDLLKVRKLVQQITQHADPCQIEDTWAVTSKNLQAAQNRFIQASKLVETSPWCLHMLAHVIRTGPFPPDKEGHEEKMGEELVKRGLKKKVMD